MTLPPNPTIDDLLLEGYNISQMAKQVRIAEPHRWTDAQWRKISKAIERVEERHRRKHERT